MDSGTKHIKSIENVNRSFESLITPGLILSLIRFRNAVNDTKQSIIESMNETFIYLNRTKKKTKQ